MDRSLSNALDREWMVVLHLDVMIDLRWDNVYGGIGLVDDDESSVVFVSLLSDGSLEVVPLSSVPSVLESLPPSNPPPPSDSSVFESESPSDPPLSISTMAGRRSNV